MIIDMNNLFNYVSTFLSSEKRMGAFLVNQHSHILASTLENNRPYEELLKFQGGNKYNFVIQEGSNYQVLVKFIPQINWKLVTISNNSVIDIATGRFFISAAVIAIICLFFVFMCFIAPVNFKRVE